jgi:hypothetical protein
MSHAAKRLPSGSLFSWCACWRGAGWCDGSTSPVLLKNELVALSNQWFQCKNSMKSNGENR